VKVCLEDALYCWRFVAANVADYSRQLMCSVQKGPLVEVSRIYGCSYFAVAERVGSCLRPSMVRRPVISEFVKRKARKMSI